MNGKSIAISPQQKSKFMAADVEWIVDAIKAAESKSPDGASIVLFVLDQSGQLRYTSNLKREEGIQVVKTWLYHQGVKENWMKHI